MQEKEINEAYTITSSKTNGLYVDEDNTCYVFSSKTRAEAFILTRPELSFDGPKYYTLTSLMTYCYAAGATVMQLTIGTVREKMPLAESMLESRYYNNQLNRVITHLRQTKKKKYLKELKDCEFIMPARIEENDNGVSIFYAVAQIENGEEFKYLAFSDLDEFGVWSGHVPGWSPIKMTYRSMWRISRHHGVILNPYGRKFTIQREHMEYIEEEAKHAKKPSKEN